MLAAVEAVHPDVHTGYFGNRTVLVENVNGVEVMGFAKHVVILVVGRGDFQATCTEIDFNIAVLNDWYLAANEGHDYLFPLEPRVFRVLGVYAHGGIAHDSFGAGRRHNSVTPFGIAGYLVAQIVELRLLFNEVHLVVRNGGAVLGIPVDHSQSAVNQPFVIEVAKHLHHSFGAGFVHRESSALPVARSAEFAKLLQDDASVVAGPVPGMFKELLTGKVGFLYTLGSELCDHLGLGRD